MRMLTEIEIEHISGGYQANFYDGIMVGGAFSSIFSLAGIVAGAFWYLESATSATYPISTIFVSMSGHSLVTLPVAIFAGIGLGGCIGAVAGIGLYYAGIVTKPE